VKVVKKNKRAIELPLWLLYIKKPWGLISHPWLFIPLLGMNLWVTLFKIKVKVIRIKNLVHGLSFRRNIKHIRSGMSRKIFNFTPPPLPGSPF
jgi:hypothetical protein